MKKITLLLFLFISSVFYSQTNGITYQAVIFNSNSNALSRENNTNSPLVNKEICLQFTILDVLLQMEYQETISITTDEFGMVNLIIGNGIQSGGYASSFSAIVWNADQKSLKVSLDAQGSCTSFEEISNQPFTSVPFALSSKNAMNVIGLVPIANGGTGGITLVEAKTNLELENVDNTSDLNKPISTCCSGSTKLKGKYS